MGSRPLSGDGDGDAVSIACWNGTTKEVTVEVDRSALELNTLYIPTTPPHKVLNFPKSRREDAGRHMLLTDDMSVVTSISAH